MFKRVTIVIALMAMPDFNCVDNILGTRMPAINPAINPAGTMQQSTGSTGGIMSTSTGMTSSQPGVPQAIPPGIDTAVGNLPIIPNPPIQGQNKDRKIIWSGMYNSSRTW